MQVGGQRAPSGDAGLSFGASAEQPSATSEDRISELLEVVRGVIPSQSWDAAAPLAKRPGKADIFVVSSQSHARRIVAKLQARPLSLLEASVYQEVLTPLGIPSVTCHGVQPSSVHPGSSWLITGFAEGSRFDPRSNVHEKALAEWIAELHARAPQISQVGSFPDHGTTYWRSVLTEAIKTLQAGIANEVLTTEEVLPLRAMVVLLEAVLEQWSHMIALMGLLPATLTHGDLVPNNVIMRTGLGVSLPLVVDWGEAGWGSPLIDLIWFEPGSYLDAVGHLLGVPQERLAPAEVISMRALGLVLWTAFVLIGDEANLSSAWPQRAVENVSWYTEVLRHRGADRLVGWTA